MWAPCTSKPSSYGTDSHIEIREFQRIKENDAQCLFLTVKLDYTTSGREGECLSYPEQTRHAV